MKRRASAALLLAIVFALTIGIPAYAQDSTPEPSPDGEGVVTTWIPIGGFYADTFPGFIEAAYQNVARFETDRLYILVMPMTFSIDATTLTPDDLLLNTRDSERRRRQLEDVCRAMIPVETYCQVVTPPIYIREAAQSPEALEYFADDLAGVYFLGGDQTIAMQITAGTPLEEELAAAFARGVVMGGNSAGLAIESRTMIGGYGGNEFGPENAFRLGAVDIWNEGERRGLDFGVTSAVLEQHFYERARIARLLNAIVQDGVPGIGIGVDSFTGALIRDNNLLESAFGVYGGAILDVETLGARGTATFDNAAEVLSVRNVLLHTFAPGDFSYDIAARQPSLAPSLTSISRAFETLSVPEGSGTLTLIGGEPSDPSILNVTPGTAALFTGYADSDATTQAMTLYKDTGVDLIDLHDASEMPDLSGYDQIIIHAGDASLVNVELIREPLQDFWLAGKPLVFVGDAAGIVARRYTAMPPTPYDSDDEQIVAATQGTLLDGGVLVREGLRLLEASVEPRLMADNRWGRLIAMAYQNPDLLAIGIPDETIIVIDSTGARVEGGNSAVTLDLRLSQRTLGTNGGFIIVNGVLDLFAPGDVIAPLSF